MRSCKEVSRLLSASQEQKLTFMQRAELKLHLAMCKHCSRFNNNLTAIRSAVQGFADGENEKNEK